MKILVDKLPEIPTECPECRLEVPTESQNKEILVPICMKIPNKPLVCKIGQEGFSCPIYREFKAVALKQLSLGHNLYEVASVVLNGEE